MTIGALFLSNAVTFGSRRFYYTCGENSLSYRNAVVRISALTRQLAEAGLTRGTPIVCYNEMPILTLDYFLAAQFLGALFVPLSPIFTVAYALKNVKKAHAGHVLCEASFASEFRDHGLQVIELKGATFNEPSPSAENFDAALEHLRKLASKLSVDDVVMLQTTSGSTGEPKLVVRRHSALLHYAKNLSRALTRTSRAEPHRYLLLLSMAHSFGFHQTTTALMIGAEIAIPTSLDTSADPGEIHALAPTIVPVPPRVLKTLVDRERLENRTGPLLPVTSEFVIVGGGRANPATLERVAKEGVKPVEIYSTSETSMVAMTSCEEWQPGVGMHLVPGVDLKFGPDSEMLIKSPALMVEYFQDPVLTSQAICEDGYYRSGDIGQRKDCGRLRYLSRKSDVFNTPEGSNIFPIRIEQMLEALPSVQQALLIGDGHPYLSALIVIDAAIPCVIDANGILDCGHHIDLYKTYGEALSQMNLSLERVEKVLRFYLVTKKFPDQCYSVVNGGKIRRDRVQVTTQLSAMIELLYKRAPDLDGSYVPGVERRLRKVS